MANDMIDFDMGTGKDGKETPQDRYHAKHRKNYCLAVFKHTEKDIYDKLESTPNMNGYIKDLIRKDLASK